MDEALTIEQLKVLVAKDNKTITLAMARDVGGCVDGWKDFCIAHKLDWKTVVTKGVKANELLKIDDQMVVDLVRFAYRD